MVLHVYMQQALWLELPGVMAISPESVCVFQELKEFYAMSVDVF